MYKRSTCIFMAAILILLVFTGCASAHKSGSTTPAANPQAPAADYSKAESGGIRDDGMLGKTCI